MVQAWTFLDQEVNTSPCPRQQVVHQHIRLSALDVELGQVIFWVPAKTVCPLLPNRWKMMGVDAWQYQACLGYQWSSGSAVGTPAPGTWYPLLRSYPWSRQPASQSKECYIILTYGWLTKGPGFVPRSMFISRRFSFQGDPVPSSWELRMRVW